MPRDSLTHPPAPTAVGRWIQSLGRDRKWKSQRQAALALGVDPKALNTWMRGEYSPSDHYQRLLVRKTGVTREFLDDLIAHDAGTVPADHPVVTEPTLTEVKEVLEDVRELLSEARRGREPVVPDFAELAEIDDPESVLRDPTVALMLKETRGLGRIDLEDIVLFARHVRANRLNMSGNFQLGSD